MRTISPWRRAFAVAAAAAVTLSLSGLPATARDVADARPAGKPTAVSHANVVGADAWAAGRARHGAKVTAAQAVDAYWTPARMRAAQPVEETAAYQDAVRKYGDANKTAPPERGAPKTIEPAPGRFDSGLTPAAWNPNYPVGQATGRTSGKVFFSTPGGTAQCSATVINSEGRDTIWTRGTASTAAPAPTGTGTGCSSRTTTTTWRTPARTAPGTPRNCGR
jgi:hypothetical protein